jgi:hypothetical protein
MTTFNIRDYALPDADPKGGGGGRTALVGVVGVGVGLCLGLGLGVGLGANFALVGALGTHALKSTVTTPALSPRERFLQCGVSEYDNAPGPEELEVIAVRWRARYAEPHWGTP